MEEKVNLSQDDVLDRIMDFPIEPLFNKVCITLNSEEEEELIETKDNILSDVQFVMAVGKGAVDTVKPGQKVLIDVEKMMVPVRSEAVDSYQTVMRIKVDAIKVGDITYALIDDRFIKANDNR